MILILLRIRGYIGNEKGGILYNSIGTWWACSPMQLRFYSISWHYDIFRNERAFLPASRISQPLHCACCCKWRNDSLFYTLYFRFKKIKILNQKITPRLGRYVYVLTSNHYILISYVLILRGAFGCYFRSHFGGYFGQHLGSNIGSCVRSYSRSLLNESKKLC